MPKEKSMTTFYWTIYYSSCNRFDNTVVLPITWSDKDEKNVDMSVVYLLDDAAVDSLTDRRRWATEF